MGHPLSVIRLGFGKLLRFPKESVILLVVVVLSKSQIIRHIKCFDLSIVAVVCRNPFERFLIDVVQMLSKFLEKYISLWKLK